MALKIHNGNEYEVVRVRSGETDKGKWLLCVIKSNPKDKITGTLFIKNVDTCGLTPKVDDGCTVRIDSFGVEREDCKGGTFKNEPMRDYPGKWDKSLTFNDAIVYKVGEAADPFDGGSFTQGTFTDMEADGELPF